MSGQSAGQNPAASQSLAASQGRPAKQVLLALALVGWLSIGRAEAQNTAPLAFGMTPEETEIALGAPLRYLSGPKRAERYVALRDAGIPGFYPVDEGIVLQYRRNRLTGWRQTWRLRRLGFL